MLQTMAGHEMEDRGLLRVKGKARLNMPKGQVGREPQMCLQSSDVQVGALAKYVC
jgi:hypothetical protein